MLKSISIKNIILPGGLFIAGFFAFLSLPMLVAAEDNDHEIFNRLYREIISSTPAGISVSMDSVRPKADAVSSAPSSALDSLPITPPVEAFSDPASERLKKEIEKMAREAQTRHSDALKFMQETR